MKQTAMKTRLIAFTFVLAGVLGCNAFKRGSDTTDVNQPTVVQVDNQGFLDMTVYAARSSQRVRLGIATGNAKTNFNIPSVLMSGLTPLRFVALLDCPSENLLWAEFGEPGATGKLRTSRRC